MSPQSAQSKGFPHKKCGAQIHRVQTENCESAQSANEKGKNGHNENADRSDFQKHLFAEIFGSTAPKVRENAKSFANLSFVKLHTEIGERDETKNGNAFSKRRMTEKNFRTEHTEKTERTEKNERNERNERNIINERNERN